MALTPKAQKLGPGQLKIGDTGSGLDISCQCRKVEITWDIDTEDDVPVLCGGTMPGDTTYTAKLSATVFQDLEADGIVEYSWKNRGKQMKFVFIPTAGDVKITGELTVHPLDVGGDVGQKNTSDLEWPIIGDPVYSTSPAMP